MASKIKSPPKADNAGARAAEEAGGRLAALIEGVLARV